jgi:4-hydroxy-2-oxoheptanedioate aldolase
MFGPIESSLALKRRMRDGQVVIGAWMDLVDPCVAEIMGGLGFEWLLIDTEHGPIDATQMLNGMRDYLARRPQQRNQ